MLRARSNKYSPVNGRFHYYFKGNIIRIVTLRVACKYPESPMVGATHCSEKPYGIYRATHSNGVERLC